MQSRRQAILALVLLCAAVAPARATDLAAHRAVYDLKLDTSKDSSVTAAIGRMDYEMLDVCDGWATRQRLAMTITNTDGQNIQMLSDYTTYESKNGLKLRFRMRQTTDEAVTSDIQGDASLAPDGGTGEAHYTLPQQTDEALPKGTLFPTMHTARLLAAAESGRKFLALPLFDGTSEKGAQHSFIFINNWHGASPDKWPPLARLPSGRFHISFFDRAPSAITPDYEVSMRYWANGVADNLVMDFGDFVMDGKLKEFHLVPPKGC